MSVTYTVTQISELKPQAKSTNSLISLPFSFNLCQARPPLQPFALCPFFSPILLPYSLASVCLLLPPLLIFPPLSPSLSFSCCRYISMDDAVYWVWLSLGAKREQITAMQNNYTTPLYRSMVYLFVCLYLCVRPVIHTLHMIVFMYVHVRVFISEYFFHFFSDKHLYSSVTVPSII